MSRFVFQRHERGEENPRVFSCDLASVRCSAETNGRRCNRKVIIGTPMCWQHQRLRQKVKIADSEIENAGKGLFAYQPPRARQRRNGVVFRAGSHIVPYGGELISNDELQRRYGSFTGPYALRVNNRTIRDTACNRGIGSLANHTNENDANAVLRPNSVVAVRPIRNGDEILVSYGDEYEFNEPGSAYATQRGTSQAVQNRVENLIFPFPMAIIPAIVARQQQRQRR